MTKWPRTTVISPQLDVIIVALTKHTYFVSVIALQALNPTLPHLRRLSLQQCLQRDEFVRSQTFRDNAPFRLLSRY